MRIDRMILVGCGGTGSHLLAPLARLLDYHEDGIEKKYGEATCILVDGDKFEEKNGARQIGSKPGKSKAQIAAKRIKAIFPEAIPVERYVNRFSFKELVLDAIPDGPFVCVLAVDNHATRKDCLQALHDSKHKSFQVLNPGNDLAHGSVHNWIRHEGKDLTPWPLAVDGDGNQMHPEIHSPKDHIPGGGCSAQAPSTPQLIGANAGASLACLWLVQAYLDGEPMPDEVCFDSRKFKLVPAGELVKMPTAAKAKVAREPAPW